MDRNIKFVDPSLDMDKIIPGDMPGDKIHIGETHIKCAQTIYPFIRDFLKKNNKKRTVISVFGGSGVGKSEIGSLLAYYCREAAIPAYVLSGDNYPYRIPVQNDTERLSIFRSSGLSAMSREKGFQNSWDENIHKMWRTMADADPGLMSEPGMRSYQTAGRDALYKYLGSDREIDFKQVNAIIDDFKQGCDKIVLKRMGRTSEDIHFEAVDFTSVDVLIIEWTHGNNPALNGIDFPVFLFSTPEETLAYRRQRGRDKGADSFFTKLVLKLEQDKINIQAQTAALIVNKSGRILSYMEMIKELKENG